MADVFFKSTMCGHTSLVYLTLMVKMENYIDNSNFFKIQDTKIKLNISISLIRLIIS
jgi:hypothetical protein